MNIWMRKIRIDMHSDVRENWILQTDIHTSYSHAKTKNMSNIILKIVKFIVWIKITHNEPYVFRFISTPNIFENLSLCLCVLVCVLSLITHTHTCMNYDYQLSHFSHVFRGNITHTRMHAELSWIANFLKQAMNDNDCWQWLWAQIIRRKNIDLHQLCYRNCFHWQNVEEKTANNLI